MSKSNLIDNEEVPENLDPPPYEKTFPQSSNIQGDNFDTVSVPIAPQSAVALTNSINCQVCRQFINLDQKLNNLVVKCNSCGEATPIKAAPPGKKYVRCTCNGLLICKASSTKVGCPRPNCKSVITLTPSIDDIGVSTAATSQSGLLFQSIRVICARCGNTFVVNAELNRRRNFMAAKCPHCQTMSSVGPGYSRIRWLIYFFIGLMFLFLGIGVTVGTYASAPGHGGYYVVYIGAFVVGIIFMVRSFFYCCMPISVREESLSTNNV